jgi:hypothetical protein
MPRSPEHHPWLTRTAAIWRSDGMFRISITVLTALLVMLISLHN